MKKLLLLWLMMQLHSQAQQVVRIYQYSTAPSGGCQYWMEAVDLATNDYYKCIDGVWAKIVASGGALGGSGTSGTISKFTGASTLGNSSLTDDGSVVTSSIKLKLGDFLEQIATNTTFSATPTFDTNVQNHFSITLTADVTSSTLSGTVTSGYTELVTFLICQDGTGNWTFTWPTNIKGAMTIAATASKCNSQSFRYDGTTAYAISSGVTGM